MSRTRPTKTKLHQRLVSRHFKRQEGRCFYCARDCELAPRGAGIAVRYIPYKATLEHLKGWKTFRNYQRATTEGNTVMACEECNSRRNSYPDLSWLGYFFLKRLRLSDATED